MPTEYVTTEAPAAQTTGPASCLLHADFHVMGRECHAAAVDWYFTQDHLEGTELRDAYEAAVERRMLDQLVVLADGIITA